MGTQRFETGISSNNLKHWGKLEAMREFVQNIVYAKTILKDEIRIVQNVDGSFTLGNTPSGFTKGKLLIGESNQADVKGAPGQYGEGMKVAMAVALREGMEVVVITNGFTVTPTLEPSSIDPEVNSLVFYIEDNDCFEGTEFRIKGCEPGILEKAQEFFAVLQGVDPEVTKRDSLMTQFPGIYANGVKITNTPSIFGYNFTDTKLINRDRSTVDMDLLKKSTRTVLSHLEDQELITEIVQGITEDDSYLESQSGLYSCDDLPLWKKVVHFLFGDKVALATGTDSDTAARYKKFNLISKLPNAWTYFFKDVLQILPSNQLRATTVEKNTHRKATADENKNLGWAKRLVKLYYADYGTVRVSEVVIDEHNNQCNGIYDRETDTIWIKRELLSSKEKLFKVLMHETIHRETGYDDNTTGFTKGWETACWGILTRGKGDA